MGKPLQNRIVAFMDAVPGEAVAIDEVVTAFPDVDTDSLVAALRTLSTEGKISLRGAVITVRAQDQVIA
jgi:hypothetical protein